MPVMRFAVKRYVAQQHAGVDREVVDSLLRLFDQRIAEEFPVELFGLPADLFQRLIDRHGADRHRRVAQNPLARLVDVFTRGKIHYRVGAPARGPGHLFDLFVDRRRDRGVADVGVDLHEKAAADDHRFALGMIHVVGKDRASARDLVAHEFAAHALAQRNELHLRRDLAAPCVVHLRYVGAGLRATRTAHVRKAQIVELCHCIAPATIERRRRLQLGRVVARVDPRAAHLRQAVANVELHIGIRIRPARIVQRMYRSVGQRQRAPGDPNRRVRASNINLHPILPTPQYPVMPAALPRQATDLKRDAPVERNGGQR